MMHEPSEYAKIEDTTEDECFERWGGVEWQEYEDSTDLGICYSTIDFDSWAEEYEERHNED